MHALMLCLPQHGYLYFSTALKISPLVRVEQYVCICTYCIYIYTVTSKKVLITSFWTWGWLEKIWPNLWHVSGKCFSKDKLYLWPLFSTTIQNLWDIKRQLALFSFVKIRKITYRVLPAVARYMVRLIQAICEISMPSKAARWWLTGIRSY